MFHHSTALKRLEVWLLFVGIIVFAVSRHQPKVQAAETPVTYSHQVAPILYAHCATCHHTGGGGPFSLMSYAEAQRRGQQILTVTQSRYMPPWLPEPGHGDFADNRRLGDHDREILREWVMAGMPQGDLSEAPAPPTFNSEWELGKPDLVLEMTHAFTTPASGTDVFENVVLPFPLDRTKYIRAMEIRPGVGANTASVIHHANVVLDRTGSYRRQHPDSWETGVPGMELVVDAGSTFDPDSHFLFWKPDSPAIEEPEGLEWHLDAGDDLILNMHIKPTGKPETIKAQIGLYFRDKPPIRHPMLLQLEDDRSLDIPAGAARFSVEDELKLPIAVTALGVYPHAHYLGKEMEAWATLPDGSRKWLVLIRDWDIDRQSVYRYREPVLLPKGTVLHMHYVYDNSTANMRNPHQPPVRVKAGNRSEDEMGHLWLEVLPVEATIGGKDPRLLLEQAWMQNRLRKNAGDAVALYNLAASMSELGKTAEAQALFQKILAGNPDDVRTLTAFGAATAQSGDWQKAESTFERALQINPEQTDARFDLASLELAHEQYDKAEANFAVLAKETPGDAAAHGGLGAALAGEGHVEGAETEFSLALAIDSKNRFAQESLGMLQLQQGKLSDAIEHLKAAIAAGDRADTRRELAAALAQSGELPGAEEQARTAIRLDTNDVAAHSLLSQLEGALGKPDEAIAEQKRALELAPNDPDGWNNLGVLYARSKKTEEARTAFQHALSIDSGHAQAKANLARLSGSAEH